MKFYESVDSSKPVIFLFPGTCCLYSSFEHVLDGLHSYFYTVIVSYDGFNPNEKNPRVLRNKDGKKYEKRYCTYFKNPDIRRHNMQHEELFCCHSAEWVEEVRKAVEGDKQ